MAVASSALAYRRVAQMTATKVTVNHHQKKSYVQEMTSKTSARIWVKLQQNI